ncbi:hypothetical protein AAF712_011427, partial [Marasmius tenuissimus]
MLGAAPNKWGFLVDELGGVANEKRIGEMTQYLYRLCDQLNSHNQAPLLAGKMNDTALKYVSHSMCKKFTEFGLCEKQWKFKAFLKEKYPDFKRCRLNGSGETQNKHKNPSSSTTSRKPKRTKTDASTSNLDAISEAMPALPRATSVSPSAIINVDADSNANDVIPQPLTQAEAGTTQDVVPLAAVPDIPATAPKRRGNPLTGLRVPKTAASTPVPPPAE